MSHPPPPYYTQQPAPYPAGQYYPSQPYPPQGGYYPGQPNVVYVEETRRSPADECCDSPWLTSLLMLLCGCCLGEALCDSPCLCCVIPIPCPPFGRRR